jgi:RNA polymerase sigma-70 factor (ECF subfamily)|nr:sigma factor-like helix-turn-helix DNA-binding protein [Kofleriaceae bacterium]
MSDRYERARAAWPGVEVSRDVFDAALAARVTADDQLDALHASDVYLAVACAAGDPAALAALDRHGGDTVRRATSSAGATASEQADLAQVIRERLLVPPAGGGPAKIAAYSGKGALLSWLRVVATREAIRMLPIARREPALHDDDLAYLVAPDDNPELGYLKRLYRAEFKDAFQAAVATLPDRDRLVLRQSVLDGLGIDALAKLHGVHRATCARWLESARAAILATTQKILIERLELSRDELQSVIRLISSRLDVSLARVL